MFDICIIGSGAGAGPIAYELTKAGKKVVILEKGGFMIDPTINDPDAPIDENIEFDWEAVNEEFKDTTKYMIEDTSDNKLAAILKIIDTK